MSNCLSGLTIPSAPGLAIQYSVNGTTGWTSTLTSSHKYIRFSVNGGSTWSAGVRFVGIDGTNGTDATSMLILYNDLTSNQIILDGLLNTGSSYTVAGNTLAEDGDALKVTAIFDLPLSLETPIDITLSLYIGPIGFSSIIGTSVVSDIPTSATNIVRLESTINRINFSNQLIDSVVLRKGDPGDIIESPEIYTLTNDLTGDLIVRATATSSVSISPTVVTLKMLKVEVIKMTT